MSLEPELNFKNQEDTDLISTETLDRSSPELWPQPIPGINEFASFVKNTGKPSSKNNINNQIVLNSQLAQNTPRWMSDLNKEDIELLNDLATLSTNQLMDKVKDMIDQAYQLGLEETNQMTRGKLLNILDSNNRD